MLNVFDEEPDLLKHDENRRNSSSRRSDDQSCHGSG
jgi:hypothetical protein